MTCRKSFAWLVVICFVALTTLPLVLMGTLGVVQDSAENRQLSPFPHLPERHFARDFEAWFNDHFRLRDTLVHSYNRIKVFGLGTSTRTGVTIGRDGWLYYSGDAMDAATGRVRLPAAHMAGWRAYLEGLRDWLAERGVAYLFVITPNKQEIHPAFLPRRFGAVGPSVREQMSNYLHRHSDLSFIDLTPVLQGAKGDDELFFRTDSHWNPLGAYYGYRAIMERLQKSFPSLAPKPLSDFTVSRENRDGGDLAQLFNLRRDFSDLKVTLTPSTPPCAKTRPLSLPGDAPWATARRPQTSTCATAPRINMVMLRDSFSNDLIPLLSEHFRRADYLAQANIRHPLADSFPALKAVAADTRPRLVIDQIAARKLVMPAPFFIELHMATLRRHYRRAPIQKQWLAPTTGTRAEANGPIRIQPQADGIRIDVDGPGTHITVDGAAIKKGRWPVLGIDLKAPAQTIMTLSYRHPDEAAFTPQNLLRVRLAKGPNRLYLPLPDSGPIGALMLAFGPEPGRYVLTRLEARAVDRDFATLPGTVKE